MSIFDDSDDIFDDSVLDTQSLQTKAEEVAQQPHAALVKSGAPKQKTSLVAYFDETGAPLVARASGEKRLEAWRRPTNGELEALRKAGRFVKGGLIDDGPNMQSTPLGGVSVDWKKLALWGGGAVVLGAAGWWGYKRWVSDD